MQINIPEEIVKKQIGKKIDDMCDDFLERKKYDVGRIKEDIRLLKLKFENIEFKMEKLRKEKK